jgi:hypothetical protein
MISRNSFSSPINLLQPIALQKLPQAPQRNRPNFSMIWINKIDLARQRLVAIWTKRD